MKRIRSQQIIHKHLLEGIKTPKQEIIDHVKRNMCIDMAMKLSHENIITFEENDRPSNGAVGTEINAEFYVMTVKEVEAIYATLQEIYDIGPGYHAKIRLDELVKILNDEA